MQNPPENLIYLLVLALAYFANYLFKRFVPRMEPEPPQAEVDQGQTAQEPVPVGLAAASIASLTPLPGPQVAVAKAMLPTQPPALAQRATYAMQRAPRSTACDPVLCAGLAWSTAPAFAS